MKYQFRHRQLLTNSGDKTPSWENCLVSAPIEFEDRAQASGFAYNLSKVLNEEVRMNYIGSDQGHYFHP